MNSTVSFEWLNFNVRIRVCKIIFSFILSLSIIQDSERDYYKGGELMKTFGCSGSVLERKVCPEVKVAA